MSELEIQLNGNSWRYRYSNFFKMCIAGCVIQDGSGVTSTL